MVATAKIAAKKYPGYKKVYIGPCFAKKAEAKEDHSELDILVLTYKELDRVFEMRRVSVKRGDKSASFDIEARKTRLYPISGGLAQSSGITKKYTDSEYDVISGPELVQKVLKDFLINSELKILDILFCEGGCIGGPGIISDESIEKRREKVIKSWEKK
jgi:iron only hydrogenase large subunit-like protein